MGLRWTIYLVDLDPVIGSEQGKRRPVVIISDEEINELLPVVNVLPLTSYKAGRRVYANEVFLNKNEVFLNKNEVGLEKDSLVLCYQIRTIDKQRLIGKLGEITIEAQREKIIEALSFQLGI